MEEYEEFLEAIRPEVSFGVTTIRVFRAPELASLQVGYAVSLSGESLTSDKDGDWLQKWVVIGHEDACGDPIFIDTSEGGFPVYTAIHGEGAWEAKRVAASLAGFGRALSVVADIARGREHPVALENNPLTQSEKEAALTAIQRDNPGVDMDFWETLLS
jgi:hypothetical protein